ncbi:SWIM zinc finger family protein [Aureimonas psammosilenae]|uniref:SWIM zinc finger family protein n=1 Tax=Aureimonas psammosilenae TaxID=2495496 RepID=UPI001260F70F|nr:SWIM zinc finger family protein [Aureimonas psammosilenae]
MARRDLLELTDDGLAQIGNAGLLKRSLRELEAGTVPTLAETADGTIEARFADGTLTRLPPGALLDGATCTCPSSGVCRHRIMLAVTYRAANAASRAANAAETWDPADLDLESFEAALGPAARADLHRLLAARQTVRLDRGRPPAAHLPMASVRFLVPDEIAYARCDCAQEEGCAHVALAIRAFRASGGAGEAAVGGAPATAAAPSVDALRGACDAVVQGLLRAGVVAGSAAHAGALALAEAEARRLGASQILLALEALAEQVASYERRSARHDEREVLMLIVDLHARTHAIDMPEALGCGEPFETAMTRSRLVSLGARLRGEGAAIRAGVLLADSDTGATVLLERLLSPRPGDRGLLAANLAGRLLAPALPLVGTARGQILTSVAHRRADGLLRLGRGSGGQTQLVPRGPEATLPPALAVTRVDAVVEALAARPFLFLRARRRVADTHVFPVGEVLGQSWSAGSQSWYAAVRLPDGGGILHLERPFDSGAPNAATVLAAALDGHWGPLRSVTGPVRVEAGALVCDPWSLVADRFVVPDIDDPPQGGEASPSPGGPASAGGVVDEAAALLAGALHAGARAREAQAAALGSPLAARLGTEGYRELAARLSAWLNAGAGDEAAARAAFCEAALWCRALDEIGASA